MRDSYTIPWKRLTAEGFVVVVSILLAFSIDAWWDGYKDTQRQRNQLAAMREEFADSLLALDEVLNSVREHKDGIEELRAILKAAGGAKIDVPGPLLGYAIGWRTADVSTSTLDALIASGDLNLLANESLRNDLAKLPAVLLDVTENEVMALEFAESVMASLLAREGLAEAAYANLPGRDRGGTPDSAEVAPSIELLGLLMARQIHFEGILDGYPSVTTHLEKLIAQIDDELAHASSR